MLRILGSAKKLCDGWTRREMLCAGGWSALCLSMADLLRFRAAQAAESQAPGAALPRPSFGKAKSCIILYLYGAPSQLELYDLKPAAPEEIRGTFKPIATSLPGLQICEHLPRMARIMDRATVVRSMTHPYNIHSAAYALTGVPHVDIPMEINPVDTRHWPFIGSVLDYLEDERNPGAPPPAVPRNVGLPFQFSSRSPEFTRGGPYGGFLGPAYNPVWTEFEGSATTPIDRWRGDRDSSVADPYAGIGRDSRFLLASAAQLPPEITLDRLSSRRTLVQQFDRARRSLGDTPTARGMDRFKEMAYSLMTSEKMRSALDLQREPIALREKYGITLFGQATLVARRLIEAGVKLATVFWDEYQLANTAWDTHFDHFTRLKDELLPGLDQAFSALIEDLEARGLLDETLVMCISEHGRTPRLTKVRGGGREHWSRVYSGLFAGGGIARGNVVGESDKHASDPIKRPVSPKDILATAYHLLGIDHRRTLIDRLNRPLPLVADGEVVGEMLA